MTNTFEKNLQFVGPTHDCVVHAEVSTTSFGPKYDYTGNGGGSGPEMSIEVTHTASCENTYLQISIVDSRYRNHYYLTKDETLHLIALITPKMADEIVAGGISSTPKEPIQCSATYINPYLNLRCMLSEGHPGKHTSSATSQDYLWYDFQSSIGQRRKL